MTVLAITAICLFGLCLLLCLSGNSLTEEDWRALYRERRQCLTVSLWHIQQTPGRKIGIYLIFPSAQRRREAQFWHLTCCKWPHLGNQIPRWNFTSIAMFILLVMKTNIFFLHLNKVNSTAAAERPFLLVLELLLWVFDVLSENSSVLFLNGNTPAGYVFQQWFHVGLLIPTHFSPIVFPKMVNTLSSTTLGAPTKSLLCSDLSKVFQSHCLPSKTHFL